MLKHESLNI